MPSEITNIVDDGVEDMTDIASTTDDAGAQNRAESPADAGSSTATDGSKASDDSTLSIVRNVVDEDGAEEGASSASGEDGTPPDTATQEDDKTKDGQDDYSDVPFNKHPRFQEVLGKVRSQTEEIAALKTQFSSVEKEAENYRNVEGFLQEHNLGSEEAAELLEIGGLIKLDPQEAWRRMKPKVEEVLRAAGEILPEDLSQQVRAGDMLPATALEISRSRAAAKIAGTRREFDQQRATTRQQTEQVTAIQSAVKTWEADRRKRDPHFADKMEALQKEVTWLQRRDGRPHTPEGALDQIKAAYETVNKSLPARTPAPADPRARRPAVTPITGGQVGGTARPKPRNTLDIIDAELARSRAG